MSSDIYCHNICYTWVMHIIATATGRNALNLNTLTKGAQASTLPRNPRACSTARLAALSCSPNLGCPPTRVGDQETPDRAPSKELPKRFPQLRPSLWSRSWPPPMYRSRTSGREQVFLRGSDRARAPLRRDYPHRLRAPVGAKGLRHHRGEQQ